MIKNKHLSKLLLSFLILFNVCSVDLNAATYIPSDKTETHTYLSKIEYVITKIGYSGTSNQKVKFAKSEKDDYSFDLNGFNTYLSKLKQSGNTEAVNAAKIYDLWVESINAYNKQNGGTYIAVPKTNVPVQGPLFQYKTETFAPLGQSALHSETYRDSDSTHMVFVMDFEDYICKNNKAGNGKGIAENVGAQDFFRNFFSDITSSNIGKKEYRENDQTYGRVAVTHTHSVYASLVNSIFSNATERVNLSTIAAPFVIKYTPDNNSVDFNYEIVITAYLKQIVDTSKLFTAGNSSVNQQLEYFSYRQYIKKINKCPNSGTRQDLEFIQNHVYTEERFKTLIRANTTTNNMLYVDNSSAIVSKYPTIDDLLKLKQVDSIYMACPDTTHTNLNLVSGSYGEKIDRVDNSSNSVGGNGRGVHLHSITLDITKCETYQYIKRYIGEWTPYEGYSRNVECDWSTPCHYYGWRDDWVKLLSYTYQIQDPNCHGKGYIKCDHCNEYGGSGGANGISKECEYCHGAIKWPCHHCGESGRISRYGFKLTVKPEWDEFHKHEKCKCFVIDKVKISGNTYGSYYGVVDSTSTVFYQSGAFKNDGSIVSNKAESERIGKVNPFKYIRWYYRGRFNKYDNSGAYYLEFGPVTGEKGNVIVENFVSM